MPGRKIFISYSRLDGQEFALKLASDLKKVGVNVWVDQLDIALGKIWDKEIETALESSECVLFIATEKSVDSVNVLNEVYYALEENKQVIPVIAAKCKLPFRLKRLQYIDFTPGYDQAFKGLLNALHTDTDQITDPEIKETQFVSPLEITSKIPTPPEVRSFSVDPVISTTPSSFQRREYNNPGGGPNKKMLVPFLIGGGVLLVVLLGWIILRGNSGKVEDNLVNNYETSDTAESIQKRNERVALETIKAINMGDIEAFIKDISPDFVDYGDYSGAPYKEGIDSLKEHMRQFFKGFPDYTITDIRTAADGDSVIVYSRCTGTFKNDMPGFRATGKSFDFRETEVFKFNDLGKIVGHSSSSAGIKAMVEVSKMDTLKK